MKVWKWLGWDTKDARTERLVNSNWHGTARTLAWCCAFAFMVFMIWGA